MVKYGGENKDRHGLSQTDCGQMCGQTSEPSSVTTGNTNTYEDGTKLINTDTIFKPKMLTYSMPAWIEINSWNQEVSRRHGKINNAKVF